jgi:hypothetical protein
VHEPTPVAGFLSWPAPLTAPLAGLKQNPANEITVTTAPPANFAFHLIIDTPAVRVPVRDA